MKESEFRKKKIRYILLLSLSQLLLCLFVAYWLVTQYQKEKQNLKMKISFVRAMAYNAIQEREFLKYDNALSDSVDMAIEEHKQFFPDSVILGFNREFFVYNKGEKKDFHDLIKRDVIDTTLIETNKFIVEQFKTFNEKMRSLIQGGVERRDPFFHRPLIPMGMPREQVDSLFMLYIDQYIEEYNINVKLNWIPDSVSIPQKSETLSFPRYNHKLNKPEVDVVVEYRSWYILKLILPQIIFAILLLGVLSFALLFTYRGYTQQIKLNLLRRDFIRNITHELKIPVSTAQVAIEALGSYGLKSDPERMDEYLGMVKKEMGRLDKLTTRILNHAKIEDGKLNLKFEQIELNSFLKEIVDATKLYVIDKNIHINYNEPQEKLFANVDHLHFEGVLKNLIDNSIKYGGDTIDLNLWKDEQELKISLTDNGPGIPEEYLGKVFDSFFRVPKGDTHNVKGYGLGLSYAALVMNLHSGSIKVENLKEGGCQFTLSISSI